MKTYVKRLASVIMTAAFAVSMMCTTASAKVVETGFKKPADESLLVAYPDGEKQPTLSFDTKDCLNYVAVTEDGINEAAMKIERQTKVRYQGGCLKLSVDNKTVRSGDAGDTTLPNVYDLQMGIELKAEDFGLENFDGCIISMMVKFHPDVVPSLYNSELGLYSYDANEGRTGQRSVQYSEIEAKGFRNAMLTILEPEDPNAVKSDSSKKDDEPPRGDTTTFIVSIPLIAAYAGDAIYFDNLIIQTPLKDADGNSLYVKNLDGYNASASVDNTENIVEVGDTVQADSVVTESVPDEAGEGGKSVILIIIIVAAVVVLGIGVVIFIKMRNRYY